MFDQLGDKLEGVFRKLRGQAALSESNMKEALREVRLALLEADVNYKVVKDFVGAVQEKALGLEVTKGVNPAQQLVKVVNDELVAMMKGDVEDRPFVVQPGKQTMILMLGLQGSGKTTFCGKLATHLLGKGCKPLLAACDIYRPAAVDQLKSVGKTVGVPVFERGTDVSVLEIVEGAVAQAKKSGRDVVIVDTAGRLHIDEVKMDELVGLRDRFKPDYTFLVADAMTGQDAVNSAKTFDEQVGIDGVCLTKMDGDSRGGAALSIKAVTGKPIVFIGMGEKPTDLEGFHPDRVASRILGMGDVVSLVEKAQQAISEEDAMDMQEKLATGSFSWNDFLKQMRTIRKMGSLKGLLGLIPGVGNMMKGVDNEVLDGELKRVEAMIQSMTEAERRDGNLLTREGNRRLRIARGAGLDLKRVNETVKQFDQMKSMMQQMAGGGDGGLMGRMGAMMKGGGNPMEAMAGMDMFGPGGTPPDAATARKMLKAQKAMMRSPGSGLTLQPKQVKAKNKNKKRRR